MAVIEKIRRRSGLLIAIIGIALLAFVLQDLFRSSTGNRRAPKLIVVDGKELPFKDFENASNNEKEKLRRYYGSLTQDQEININNAVLDKMVKDYVMNKEFDAVGMTVTDDGLRDQFFGEEPHQKVIDNFPDGNGSLDREGLAYYVDSLLPRFSDQYRNEWVNFENEVKEERLSDKFVNLVKASYYIPKRLAEKYHEDKETKAKVEVIALRYSNITDTLNITDQDKKNYYEENKYLFETDETRSIEYVIFEINPSEADDAKAKEEVENLKDNFSRTENLVNFMNNNSEQPYDSTWLGRPDVPAEAEAMLFDPETEPGFVYGPYLENNSYKLVRLVDRQVIEDSLMVRVAVLSKTPTASSQTDQAVKSKAYDFVSKNKTLDEFNATVEAEGMTKRAKQKMTSSDYFIPGLTNARQIVRWAFDDNTKVGDVSEIFDFEDMYVVAVLTEIIPEGYVPMDLIAEQHKNPIMNKKRGEIAVERMKAYGTDYDRMVKELGAERTVLSDINLEDGRMGNFGIEGDIVGTVMAMKEGEVVGPIAGNTSAFILMNAKKEAPATAVDYSVVARDKKSQFNNRVKGPSSTNPNAIDGIYNAISKNIKIKDNRAKFY